MSDQACMKMNKILIIRGLTASSSSLFFQSDTLLSFLTIQESLTYTALLTLKNCSNSSIKKKVSIIQSSTRKSYGMSCNACSSSAFHPWLCLIFMRFCNPHSAHGDRSPCWGVGHKLSSGPTSSRGLCWCRRTSRLCWTKPSHPKLKQWVLQEMLVWVLRPEGNLSSLGIWGHACWQVSWTAQLILAPLCLL